LLRAASKRGHLDPQKIFEMSAPTDFTCEKLRPLICTNLRRGTAMTELLDSREAARQLNVTEGTLAVWRATKRYPLRYVKIGRKIRYRPADLEAFLEARTHSGVSDSEVRTKCRRSRSRKAA
jgi:excisionase family DNA binding protein